MWGLLDLEMSSLRDDELTYTLAQANSASADNSASATTGRPLGRPWWPPPRRGALATFTIPMVKGQDRRRLKNVSSCGRRSLLLYQSHTVNGRPHGAGARQSERVSSQRAICGCRPATVAGRSDNTCWWHWCGTGLLTVTVPRSTPLPPPPFFCLAGQCSLFLRAPRCAGPRATRARHADTRARASVCVLA